MNLGELNALKLLAILAGTAVVAGGTTYVVKEVYTQQTTSVVQTQEATQERKQFGRLDLRGRFEARGSTGTQSHGPTDHVQNSKNLVDSLPKQDLSDAEKEAILYMREEEKLARDVYLTLYDKWDEQIFKNIAQSEQRHTDAIKALIEKYDLEDPVKDDSIGVFTNTKLAELYNQLVEQGSKSLVDALKVGATIEDLDISDLNKDLAETDNEDIKKVFEYLREGSYNHLRAFVDNLKRKGADYTPQFISEEEYERILSTTSQHGHGDTTHTDTGTGRGQGGGRGMRGRLTH